MSRAIGAATCIHDHVQTPANVLVSPSGYRKCRPCATEAMRRRRAGIATVRTTWRERWTKSVIEQSADTDACVPWPGRKDRDGYGIIGTERNTLRAHRAVYEQAKGPIPDGLTIDHVCHTNDAECPGGRGCRHRACCNPAHLEAVTSAENLRRRDSRPYARPPRPARQECCNGHNLAQVGTQASGKCKACQCAAAAAYRLRRLAAGAS